MRASVALIDEFKRARSAWRGVDARVNFRSVNMEATSKASSIPLISIVGEGRGHRDSYFSTGNRSEIEKHVDTHRCRNRV